MSEGDEEYVALEAMIRILLDSRPTGYVTRDLASLLDRFGHLPPFAGYVWRRRTKPTDLKNQLAIRLEAWLPRDPAGLKLLGLSSDPAGRELVARIVAKESGDRGRDLPYDWEERDSITWSREMQRAFVRTLSRDIADHLSSLPGPVGRAPTPVALVPASGHAGQEPTWRLPAFDGVRERPATLGTIEDWIRSGSTPMLVVEGSPGTGKSSLLVSLLRRVDDGQAGIEVAAAIVRDTHRADPYDVISLLRGVIGVDLDGDADPALLEFLATSDVSLDPARMLPLAERTIAARPPDRIALVVVDAIDQAEDAQRQDLIEVLDRLVRQASGTGFRFVLSSRRALPAGLPTSLGVALRLDESSDAAELREELDELLAPLHPEDLPRVRSALLDGSAGSWLWACLHARALARDAAHGRVEWPLRLGVGLQGLWADGVAAISRRTGEDTYDAVVRPLLGCLSVATEGRLGVEELRWTLEVDADQLTRLTRHTDPLVSYDSGTRTLRLCHPDLGRWFLSEPRWGMSEGDAHLLLASGLARMGRETHWAPVTRAYAAQRVLDHLASGVSLDPFRPDRQAYVALAGDVLGDPGYVEQVEDGVAFSQTVQTLGAIVPELEAPHGGDLVSVFLMLAMSAEAAAMVGATMLRGVSYDAAERMIEVVGDRRKWRSPEHALLALRSEVPGVGQSTVLIWAAYLAGLFVCDRSSLGAGGVRLDTEAVTRYLSVEPATHPSVRAALDGIVSYLATESTDVIPWLRSLLEQPSLAGLTLESTAEALESAACLDLSLDQATEIVEVADTALGRTPTPPVRALLLRAIEFALDDPDLECGLRLAQRRVAVVTELLGSDVEDTSPEPYGHLFRQRSLLRARTSVQESVPFPERDPDECAAISAETQRALDHPDVRQEFGSFLRWDLRRALLLRYQPGPEMDAEVLDLILDAERDWMASRTYVDRRGDWPAVGEYAKRCLHRWHLGGAQSRPGGLLDAGLAAIDEVRRVPGQEKNPAHLDTHVRLLMEKFYDEPDLPTGSLLVALGVELLALVDADGDYGRFLSELLDDVRARMALLEPAAPPSVAPSVDELRARLDEATPQDRTDAVIDLVNAIRPGAAPPELLEERVELLRGLVDDRVSAQEASGSDAGLPGIQEVRLPLARTLRALGRHGEALSEFVSAAAGGTFAGCVQAVEEMAATLGKAAASDVLEWAPVAMRLADHLAAEAAVAAEAADPAERAALGVRAAHASMRIQVRLVDVDDPRIEIDWPAALRRARVLDDAMVQLGRELAPGSRVQALMLQATLLDRLGKKVTVLPPYYEEEFAGFLDRYRTAGAHGALVGEDVGALHNAVFGLIATVPPSEEYPVDQKGRDLAEVARARLQSTPAAERAAGFWQLCEGLHLIRESTVEEIEELVAASRDYFRLTTGSGENWKRRAETALWQLGELRVRTAGTSREYGEEERAFAIDLARQLMRSEPEESQSWKEHAQALYRALDHLTQTPAELDEEIELRERLLDWGSARPNACAGCLWSGLATSLFVRSRRTSDVITQLADLERACDAMARAVELEAPGVDRLRAGCNHAVMVFNLAAQGTLTADAALARAVNVLTSALEKLPDDTPLSALGQLPLTVVRAMMHAGVWPSAGDLPSLTPGS